MPQPVAWSKPGGADVARALRAGRLRAASPSSVGRSVQTHAAAALTIGAEKLVPASPVE